MLSRIPRTRQQQPVARVRRSPRPLLPESDTVVVQIAVSFTVTEGAVTEEELALWIAEAIARYHSFRAGWVGLGLVGAVTPPVVERV